MTSKNQAQETQTPKPGSAPKRQRPGLRADKSDKGSDVLAAIAEMPESDRVVAERLHEIIKANAPTLSQSLVRDARICQGRKDRLLLPKCGQVQN